MRSISFTDHLELEFEGNVLKNAVCLGDVDNDGLDELVVGNDKGELAVFKGNSTKPLCLNKGFGIVTAVAVGDILHLGRNIIVAITACGQCNLFDFKKESVDDLSKENLTPFHTQRIPANVKVVRVGDINDDGYCEVIVGLTDRVVRTFRWVAAGDGVKDKITGKLVGLNKWEFAEQIVTITLHKSSDRRPCILVSQPSGTFISLKVDLSQRSHPIEPLDESMGDFLTKISMNIPLASAKLQNAEICGNIVTKPAEESGAPSLAIATLDGILMLVRNGKILWHHSVDGELFAVSCVDLTGDGNQEVVACSWDGNTYIVKNDTGVKFAFHEAVSAFTAGMFGIENKQTPCLVYVSFNNRIFLYYNVYIPYMSPKSINETLKDDDIYKCLVQFLGISISDDSKLRELNEFVLYDFH